MQKSWSARLIGDAGVENTPGHIHWFTAGRSSFEGNKTALRLGLSSSLYINQKWILSHIPCLVNAHTSLGGEK